MRHSKNRPPPSTRRCSPRKLPVSCPGRRAGNFCGPARAWGALAVLTGCDIIDGPSAENALRIVSRFNDRVQAWLFNPNRLAPTYPESAITRPFPFNAYYDEQAAPGHPRG